MPNQRRLTQSGKSVQYARKNINTAPPNSKYNILSLDASVFTKTLRENAFITTGHNIWISARVEGVHDEESRAGCAQSMQGTASAAALAAHIANSRMHWFSVLLNMISISASDGTIFLWLVVTMPNAARTSGPEDISRKTQVVKPNPPRSKKVKQPDCNLV